MALGKSNKLSFVISVRSHSALAAALRPDSSNFGNIIPCGIEDKAVTSLQKELGREVEMEEVKGKVKKHIAELFEMRIPEIGGNRY